MGRNNKQYSSTKPSSSKPSELNQDITMSAIIPTDTSHILPLSVLSPPPPIISSYNDRIRPLLDAVDKLRNLKVMKEGIQLPTIVVVGDQSSGKSSVLESLAGISLPRGQGICTRVPLIMRLQNHSEPDPKLSLEYMGKTVNTDESHVSDAINSATQEIAGTAKGISNAPITLVVKKNGVPDLTMVDLPGITRVPIHGQPENIYDQIREIIMEYITPEESIILNVLAANVDFSTCESIMMSQSVDKTGQRTLAVVTKADKAPEGLMEKVMNDDVSIGLGYVCVRNRIGDESYEQARLEEEKLFETHHLLSKIDKSIVGIPVLAQRLVNIQATIISKCLPNIVKQINNKLNLNLAELNKMPKNLASVAEAMAAFMQVMRLVKESLRKILIRGENDEFPDDTNMHCTARLCEMLDGFAASTKVEETNYVTNVGSFLMDEIRVLEEAKGIGLPNFLSRTAFLTLLQRKVQSISQSPVDFITNVWGYIEGVVLAVLASHCDNYPTLQCSSNRAAGNLIARMKQQSIARVKEIVQMEKVADYTCDPEYISVWNRLMLSGDRFMKIVKRELVESRVQVNSIELEGLGEINVSHLEQHKHLAHQAFDLKMRMVSYWKIVLKRFVDSMALHLLLSIRNLVNEDLEMEIVNEMISYGGMERLLEESPSVAGKRDRLLKSIRLLKESNEVLAKIMDKISIME